MNNKQIISWLMEGDPSVQYQVNRDLLDVEKPGLRKKIEREGWGLKFLSCRKETGHWGRGFYQPKWTSTHYTLLDLKHLQILPANKTINETLAGIFKTLKGLDGGILPIGKLRRCDVCINGMLLNYASYFRVETPFLESVVDFLLSEKMQDGGFNCESNNKGAIHSSMHTTLSVLEGILEYQKHGYKYRLEELVNAKYHCHEFILMHRLFRSDKTGEIINPNFLKLYYPGRWYYDILKALDYFQYAGMPYDNRMDEAIEVLLGKRTDDGLWKLASKHPGQTHFDMEKSGQPSRWNTLRVLRVLKHFNLTKI